MKEILTSKGVYRYTPINLYTGIKLINKEIAKENLLLFNQIAKRNNLAYAIIYGTLLGALREHDFIDWDEDIDTYILDSEKDKFLDMLFELRENGFELVRKERRGDLYSIMRKGEYIDIYVYHKHCHSALQTLGHPAPAKYLETMGTITFFDEMFNVPNEAEEFMLFNYGPSWRTPIKWNNYEMSKMQIFRAKFNWFCYNNMPKFLFRRIMHKRAILKDIEYNERVDRLNNGMGKIILEKIPVGIYKVKEC